MLPTSLYQLFLLCDGVTTDSRNCIEYSMFIALKGDSFNGNAFAAQALEKGCSYAVIDDPDYLVEGDGRYVLVEDTLHALQQLANQHRRQSDVKIIAITGTNGKTTTKELISTVLSQEYSVLHTTGNLNNHIGVPLTLLQLKPEHELAVIEMGASHPGEIETLVRIAEPDYGIITNVGKGHLEGFGSFENVIKTKGELYDFLRERPDSVVFIDHDNPYLTKMAEGLTLIPYGSGENLYLSGKVSGNSPLLSFSWKAEQENETHRVQTQLVGDYNLPNALAAVTVGLFFGIKASDIDKAIREYTPRNNRSQLRKTKDNTLIIDAYNANPISMMAALENFRKMDASHKMLILGDMRELGSESETEHRRIIDFIDKTSFEKVALVGELFAKTGHSYQSYGNVDELIEVLRKNPPQGMTILIKGSNGIKLSKAVDFLSEE